MAVVMKKLISIAGFWLIGSLGISQTTNILSLQEAYRMARNHFPLTARVPLLEEATDLRLQQLDAARMPEITLQANGRFQTENVSLPFDIPGQAPIKLPLVSAQTTVEAQYTLFDGGLTEAQREVARASLQADRQAVTTDLYPLQAQVNRAFFSILLLRSRREVLQSSLTAVRSRIQQMEAAVSHGAALPGRVDRLQVEALRLEAQIDQAEGDIRGAVGGLSALLGQTVPADVELSVPDLQDFQLQPGLIRRPELQSFELQKNRILANEQVVAATRRPRIGAYAQAGLGYPNPLNFFDEQLSPFAVVGVRFSWKIVDWNKTKLDRQSLLVQSRLVDNQRNVFQETVEREEARYLENLNTLERQIERDEAIVTLQEKILRQVAAELDQGTITPSEYLDQVEATAQARLQREAHRLSRQQLQIDYLTHRGLIE